MNVGRTLIKAKAHLKKNEFEKANQLYSEILKVFPENQTAKKGFDVTEQRLKRTQIAEVTQNEIDEIYNLFSKGQFSQALKLSNQFIEGYPEIAFFHKISGACYLEFGEFSQALGCLEMGVKLAPEDAEMHNNLGVVLLELEQPKRAARSFKRAIKVNASYAEAFNNLGNAHKDLGYLDLALENYQKAISIKLGYAEAYNNLGYVNLQLKRKEDAILNLKKALEIQPDYLMALKNLGNVYKILGQLESAVKFYNLALALEPNDVEVLRNLSAVHKENGELGDAIEIVKKVITLKPDDSVLYNDLGVVYSEYEKSSNAVKSFEKALSINPDNVEAFNNLGVVLYEQGQFDLAVRCFVQALERKDDNEDIFLNLGNGLVDLGRISEGVKSIEKALQINPEYEKAWGNLYFSVKALDSQGLSCKDWEERFKKELDCSVRKGIYFKILAYKLNSFSSCDDKSFFQDALNALPLRTTEAVVNPNQVLSSNKTIHRQENLVSLLHFGRSGTGLLHSLIDNHPEVSSLPSIYFSEYYHAEVWRSITQDGWGKIPERFCLLFEVLFNANSSKSVPTSIGKHRFNSGKNEGMANVGGNRDEVLTVDKHIFSLELKRLMTGCVSLSPKSFFDLVHIAYEFAIGRGYEKKTIFYHIHNPGDYAKLNFIRYNPKSRLIMMVREPVQSCESWVKIPVKSSSDIVHARLVQMLFDIDQMAFTKLEVVGVRLEDLKEHPKATMKALCHWMGIQESPTLYEMTAQGKKWWGDPTSPDYNQQENPFEQTAIKRKTGSIFNEQDQFILRTLFYPFRVRFGYCEENLKGFKEDLKMIKPLLDKSFGFQEKLTENLGLELSQIMKSGPALYFRSALHDRWQILDELGDYPNMLKPLNIEGI
jgi:tetratricopeptide (TPR) repeat protein